MYPLAKFWGLAHGLIVELLKWNFCEIFTHCTKVPNLVQMYVGTIQSFLGAAHFKGQGQAKPQLFSMQI